MKRIDQAMSLMRVNHYTSVGLEGLSQPQQIAADHIEPSTTKLNFNQEGLDAIRDVI
jgi:hypothetical protein